MKIGDWSILMQPGPSPSPMMQQMADADWSFFGNHERKDLTKKLAEQPRLKPIDPRSWLPGHMVKYAGK